MTARLSLALLVPLAAVAVGRDQPGRSPAPLPQEPNTWVKRSPLPGGPPSPGLGYECSLVWDAKARRVIRFAGHNQGGGGEQNAEVWAFDPVTARWELKEPNTSPPGACCNQQNVFDPDRGRFLRFPAFSGSHGWQWFREIYLSNSSVWGYDYATNTWRDYRPAPAPRPAPLRCASWDAEYGVAVVFGGEGGGDATHVYDPYTNTWHTLTQKTRPAPRSGGNLAYDPVAKKHILFGTQFGEDAHTWAYDLRTNTWTDLKPPAMPPTDRNDPVLAYDPHSGKVIAVVRAVDAANGAEVVRGHTETWAYDTAANTWTKLNPPREPDGWANRRRVMTAAPELGALVLEVYLNPTDRSKDADREQQMWTYRAATGKPPAPLPRAEVRLDTRKEGPHLQWGRVEGAREYAVSRGTGPTPWAAKYEDVGRVAGTTAAVGRPAAPGTVVYYRVKAVMADGTESAPSPVVRAQPRTVEDVRVSVAAADQVVVRWPQQPADVTGFHVERAPVEVFTDDQILRLKKDTPPLAEPAVGAVRRIGTFERLTKVPIPAGKLGGHGFTDSTIGLSRPVTVEGDPVYAHRFRDDQLDPNGKPYKYAVYAYRVRAVNALGVESGPSSWALTIPPAVENVYAREEGTSCHLKWVAVPGAKGYRVYRMEGPKVNGPGQKVTRLTAEPVTGTTFTDPAATKDTKRYWVVAVDALGQEGVPSAPAWSWRQFRKYYEPFAGEWHQ